MNTDALTAQLSEYIRWSNTERISTKLEPSRLDLYLASPTSGDKFRPALLVSARTGPLSLAGLQQREQIISVTALHEGFGTFAQFVVRQEAKPPGDFFR